MKTFTAALATLSLSVCAAFAQTPSLTCKDQGRNTQPHFCEIRESTIASLPTLVVDGRQNGGISIHGANRSDILVRAMVQAQAGSDSEAKGLASQVIVHTSAGTVQADGPTQSGNWSVSYEIFVPVSTALNLKTHNGGVAVAGVQSAIEFHSVNGGISLKNVGGNVHGDTVNGGVSVSLAGTRWTGAGLDVSTQNGGVSLKVPDAFSALLDVATVNGGMNVKLPNARVVRGDHTLNVVLGSGGPTLHIRTQNGGVTVSGATA